MEIKKSLKTLDVKISKLATELGISRPTLDTYIDYFERGIKIPNDVYQNIFEYLFSSDKMTSIEFAQKYDYVKRVMLSDAKKTIESGLSDKREEYLATKIIEAVSSGAMTQELLEFIFLFANNYHVDLVRAISMYFNYTNGFKDIVKEEPSEIDKALFSQLAILFEKYNARNIVINEDSYQRLIEKNQSIFEKKKLKVSDEDILRYIKENLENSDSVDLDVLRKMMNDR
jgi:hypothetical protein CLOST_2514